MAVEAKTQKLTKSAIDELAPSDKPFTVYDTGLKGFSVRVAPSGVKTWQVEYRPYPGGRGVAKRRMSLGATNKLPAEEARKEAKAIFAAVARREDPARDRLTDRSLWLSRRPSSDQDPGVHPTLALDVDEAARRQLEPVLQQLVGFGRYLDAPGAPVVSIREATFTVSPHTS